MPEDPTLSLPEWVVLAVVDEAPSHGFAIASLTDPQASLGRGLADPRPVVYRWVLARLEAWDWSRQDPSRPAKVPTGIRMS